jgi:hypothetical protein
MKSVATSRMRTRHRSIVAMLFLVLAFCGTTILTFRAGADPLDPPGRDTVAPPLATIKPLSNWQPKYPFPFDQTRGNVTDVDINAEREMCGWFNADYADLKLQIERFNNSVLSRNGKWEADGIPERQAAITANIDQSVDFLAPRAQALTQSYDHADDMFFPIYEGQSFYILWQNLSNVSAGIKGHQWTWFSGPSFQRVMHYGSKIERSHVCR